jgi:hypothetical protein
LVLANNVRQAIKILYLSLSKERMGKCKILNLKLMGSKSDPSDEEILESGVRGICIGNYFKWDPISQTQLIEEKYGWKGSDREFQRTYRKMSNLDDRYENGAHDLLKFIKFGYGHGSDHASKDIRTGQMTGKQAIKVVRKLGHVVSEDLYYWLEI